MMEIAFSKQSIDLFFFKVNFNSFFKALLVSCGGHDARTCSECDRIYADWCNGDCGFCNNQCVLKSDANCTFNGEWQFVIPYGIPGPAGYGFPTHFFWAPLPLLTSFKSKSILFKKNILCLFDNDFIIR